MRTYEVSVRELLDRQSASYLRAVVAEVHLRSLKDPFFDAVKASAIRGRVRLRNGTFRFRFDPDHRGRPWRGPEFRLDPGPMTLSVRRTSVGVRGELTHESLLDAVRELLVQEVMEL